MMAKTLGLALGCDEGCVVMLGSVDMLGFGRDICTDDMPGSVDWSWAQTIAMITDAMTNWAFTWM